ncbi:MAG: o-succinylbenzoate synthase [Limnothrix sp. RL_2_0]|nr:o-succinylbenzoate synthase [Limnothrix sp. RL_2_0]
MRYQLEFLPYQRRFKIPLKTHHGLWKIREGIILSLQDEMGRITQGEIAPLPWFGTETIEQAIALCSSFGETVATAQIQAISDQFPACQFGFETGVNSELLSVSNHCLGNEKYCQLLPRKNDLLEKILSFYTEGFRTFKLKIAIKKLDQEIELCQRIIERIPIDGKLRLDANGGLTFAEAKQWLEWGDRQSKLEFIEQPLPPENFEQLLWLQQNYQTAIALDESVSNLRDLRICYENGWREIFVVKAAIAGFPSHLKTFCQNHDLDIVFSTVFETEIGRKALLNLASQIANPNRALGIGGSHWFAD